MKLKITLLSVLCALVGISSHAATNFMTTTDVKHYEASFRVAVGNLAASVTFGAKNRTNFYMWQISSSGSGTLNLNPHQCVNGGYKSLGGKSIRNFVSKAAPGVEYLVKITVDNDTVRTSFDGKVVDERVLAGIPFSTVGMRESLPEAGYFDDVTLKADGELVFSEDFESGKSSFESGGTIEKRSNGEGHLLHFAGRSVEDVIWANINAASGPFKKVTLSPNQTVTVQAEDYDKGGVGVGYTARHKMYKNPTGNQFPILAWYSIDATADLTKARYKELADCGFNLSFSQLHSTSDVEKAMSESKGTGVKQIVMCDELTNNPVAAVNRFKNEEMLAGWFLRDEPVSSDFASLRDFRDEIMSADNEHLLYLNLLPTYVDVGSLGTSSYKEYVKRFVDEVNIGIISYDNYPVVKSGNKVSVRSGFYKNLEDVSAVSRETNQPFWAFALATAHGSYPVPSINHMRFELYSALAYGAQGVQYFTYWTPQGTQWDFHNAPIDVNGKKTNVWYRIQTLNKEIQSQAWVWLGAKLLNVSHYVPVGGSVPEGTKRYNKAYLPAKFSGLSSYNSSGLCVSHLVNGKNHFLILLNSDINNAASVSINHTADVKIVGKDGKATSTGETTTEAEVEAGDYLLFTWTE